MLLRIALRWTRKFSVYLLEIKLQITAIFDFYLLRQNQDSMQNCVIQEWEVNINFSLLNYIFATLHWIFNFLLIIFSATHLKNVTYWMIIFIKNKNFFGPYNLWNYWYPMTHWSNCFYTHESFTLITYNISFILTYSLHSGRHSTLYMNERLYQQISAPCLWNWSLLILKKNTSLHDRFVYNTLYPPVNKLFLSVTKFGLYIFPYISFSKLLPMTYVLPFLRVLLRRLRMPHEFVRKKHLIFNCFDSQL